MAVAGAPAAGVGWDGNGPTAAALIYDTAHVALPAGVRAVTRKDERRLLFAVGELELLVKVLAPGASERVDVAGQLLVGGLPVADARVLLETEHGRHVGTTERGGGFRIHAASATTCHLALTIGTRVVEVPTFALA